MAEPRRKRKGRTGAGADDHAAASARDIVEVPGTSGGAGREEVNARNGAADTADAGESHRPKTPRQRMEAGYAKAEIRNQAVRAELEPLAEGQRPAVVTVCAILAALVALSILVTYAAGVKVNGQAPKLASILAPALIMGVLAWGMWRARYWAVVCFQGVLVFLIFAAVYGLMVIATSIGEFAITLGLLAVSGTLFWLMVKAMARIQMPDRLPRQ